MTMNAAVSTQKKDLYMQIYEKFRELKITILRMKNIPKTRNNVTGCEKCNKR